jgi:hypothetical protein
MRIWQEKVIARQSKVVARQLACTFFCFWKLAQGRQNTLWGNINTRKVQNTLLDHVCPTYWWRIGLNSGIYKSSFLPFWPKFSRDGHQDEWSSFLAVNRWLVFFWGFNRCPFPRVDNTRYQKIPSSAIFWRGTRVSYYCSGQSFWLK